jgi:transcription elongation factor Elf1
MAHQLVDRWDAFLGKIKGRFEELIAQAREGCPVLLEAASLDTVPMSNAWTGIVQQIHSLRQKIDDTWSDKVEEPMEDAGLGDDVIDAQRDKGEKLDDWMEREVEREELSIFASAADRIHAEAQKILAQAFKCTQCKAALPVPEKFFRSAHVTCEYCNTVNTFEPGSLVRGVEHFCSHYMARRATWREWVAMADAEQQVRSARDETIEMLRIQEEATRAYWRAYLTKRAEIVPAYAESLEKDFEGKMGAFYRDMERNEVWLSAN